MKAFSSAFRMLAALLLGVLLSFSAVDISNMHVRGDFQLLAEQVRSLTWNVRDWQSPLMFVSASLMAFGLMIDCFRPERSASVESRPPRRDIEDLEPAWIVESVSHAVHDSAKGVRPLHCGLCGRDSPEGAVMHSTSQLLNGDVCFDCLPDVLSLRVRRREVESERGAPLPSIDATVYPQAETVGS